MNKKHLIPAILLLVSNSASAELSFAAGKGIYHAEDETYGEVRWRGTLSDNGVFGTGFGERFGYTAYVGSMNTFGTGLFLTEGRFLFSFGVETADKTDIVGTSGGYELLFEWALTEQIALSLKHRSNCRQICSLPVLNILPHGSDDEANSGYNWLTLRLGF